MRLEAVNAPGRISMMGGKISVTQTTMLIMADLAGRPWSLKEMLERNKNIIIRNNNKRRWYMKKYRRLPHMRFKRSLEEEKCSWIEDDHNKTWDLSNEVERLSNDRILIVLCMIYGTVYRLFRKAGMATCLYHRFISCTVKILYCKNVCAWNTTQCVP